MDEKWEFYTTTIEPDAVPIVWGWRMRQDGALLRQSDLYDTFLSCYRNALANGFTGDKNVAITDVSGDAVKAYRAFGEDSARPSTRGE